MSAGRLEEVVRALAGPLEAEARGGFQDKAVIGQSIEEYARAWAQRARGVVGADAAEGLCASIAEALADYDAADVGARRKRVAKARSLLNRLAGPAAPRRRREARAPQKRSARRAQRRKAPRATEATGLDDPLAAGRQKTLAWIKRLARLGIETNRDLVYHFPRDYVPLKRISELVDGERSAVIADAHGREESVVREGRGSSLVRYALEVSDETGRAWVTSFARVPRRGARSKAIAAGPLSLSYAEGTRLLIEGSVRRAGRFVEVQFNGAERMGGEEKPPPGTLVPIYPLTDGVYQGQVRPVVRRILGGLPEELPDPLPEWLRAQQRLTGLREALRDIHWPRSEEAKEAARRRLAFEELLMLQVALTQRKQERQRPGSGISMLPRRDVVAALEEVLPFSLTRAQQRVISEVAADMSSDTPMSRLIQGDVGSGKTVVAGAGLLIAVQSGHQGALMAPTELLAEQHYLVVSRLLAPLGVSVELVTGSQRAKSRKEAHRRLADGRGQVAVGTHALIHEPVEFRNLGLVIVDEQHRFGVIQRSELRTKGPRADMLVMTATPIPRSLALTLYGDLDISVLDEMPPGRQPVRTSWLPLELRGEAYEFVRRQVAKGRQAYVVCPLIEESDKLQAEAATKLSEELQKLVFPELKVGLLHGALPVGEKDAVMEAFRAGELQVLCTTTVIEVGVDVPNATVMVVLNAERFGLAQLHQLRGRVGRGAHESQCILVSARKHGPSGRLAPGGEEEQAQRRLAVMLEQSDGFAIAEEDLLLRGPGEFYGTRQHGLPDFRLARTARDLEVLEEAREAASYLTRQDPRLARGEHALLREEVRRLRTRMERTAG